MTSRSLKVGVWLDCDPGHDDAFAILLSGYSPHLRLIGVSTVAGNSSIKNTTDNALSWAHIAGLGHVPVVAGAGKPLVRPAKTCPEVHGESGMSTKNGLFPVLADLQPVQGTKAIAFMCASLQGYLSTHKTKPILIATGPLTNVALLLSVYPEVSDIVDGLFIMGGAIGLGNTRPSSEFNIECDPEAAAIVFNSGIPITLVPLEVTHTALVTPAILDKVRFGGTQVSAADCVMPDQAVKTGDDVMGVTPFRTLCVNLLQYFAESYRCTFRMAAPPLHDPCAVFAAINCLSFQRSRCRVDVETSSPMTYGRTIVDLYNVGCHTDKNVDVALTMDVPAFWGAMLEAIAAADAHSLLHTGAGQEEALAAARALWAKALQERAGEAGHSSLAVYTATYGAPLSPSAAVSTAVVSSVALRNVNASLASTGASPKA